MAKDRYDDYCPTCDAPEPTHTAECAVPFRPETCFACENLPKWRGRGIPFTAVDPDQNLPLCTGHWNWWLIRFALGDDAPPCSAHLIEGQR